MLVKLGWIDCGCALHRLINFPSLICDLASVWSQGKLRFNFVNFVMFTRAGKFCFIKQRLPISIHLNQLALSRCVSVIILRQFPRGYIRIKCLWAACGKGIKNGAKKYFPLSPQNEKFFLFGALFVRFLATQNGSPFFSSFFNGAN